MGIFYIEAASNSASSTHQKFSTYSRTQEIIHPIYPDCTQKVNAYITKRESYRSCLFFGCSKYKSIFGPLFGYSKEKKLVAARALATAIEQGTSFEELRTKHEALGQGDLNVVFEDVKRQLGR